MMINGVVLEGKYFAYDGCHKIYILESESDFSEATESGYDILPLERLESVYYQSCELRFINNWKLDKTYVGQFEVAEFN